MLWIALHLPLLSLESFASTLSHPASQQPLALRDNHRILSANESARALGVIPGIKSATALALVPQLTLGQASPERDAQALTAVAHTALAFTPMVVIRAVNDAAAGVALHTVLLEVSGSLRYFGGRETLLLRLHAVLAPLGHCLQIASASTALGAALLAPVHRELHCADLASTRRALDATPVWLLDSGLQHREALQGMGLRTLGDLRRMPRAGLARRFGEAVLSELDRAFGNRPDPYEPLCLPPSFDSRLELFARADTTEQVLQGAGMLLTRLVAWLCAQHAFACRFTLVMQHEARWRESGTPSATTLEIALAKPSRDVAHLLVLLRERLAQIELPAPTLELRIHVDDMACRSPLNTELFPTSRSEQEGLTRLIERLQARLGSAQVQRLRAVEDHRPERATQVLMADARCLAGTRPGGSAVGLAAPSASAVGLAVPGTSNSGSGMREPPAAGSVTPPSIQARPVWLLAQAEPLRERASILMLDGQPLQLLSGPERIESGWWDGALAERDYYIAQKPDGALVWIYRARVLLSAPVSRWFLQGRFG